MIGEKKENVCVCGGGYSHFNSQDWKVWKVGAVASCSGTLFQLTMVFRKYEHFPLHSQNGSRAWGGKVDKSSNSDLLGWFLFSVDGDHSVVKLVKVGEPGASVSGLQGWPVQCCQHIVQASLFYCFVSLFVCFLFLFGFLLLLLFFRTGNLRMNKAYSIICLVWRSMLFGI